MTDDLINRLYVGYSDHHVIMGGVSEIRTSLDFKWLKGLVCNGQDFERDLKCEVQISNGILNSEAQPFEIWLMGRHFVKPFEIRTNVFQMVLAKAKSSFSLT